MLKLKIYSDGSIEFLDGQKPKNFSLQWFIQDLNNENLYHPKLKPCIKRQSLCRMSSCGRRPLFLWHCYKFKKSVNVLDCENCNASET